MIRSFLDLRGALTFVSSEGEVEQSISADGLISELRNRLPNNDFCLGSVRHRDDERGFQETFREDFAKRVDFDNGDFLVVFPDSTRVAFEKAALTFIGGLTSAPSRLPARALLL